MAERPNPDLAPEWLEFTPDPAGDTTVSNRDGFAPDFSSLLVAGLATQGIGVIAEGTGYKQFGNGLVLEWGDLSYTGAISNAFMGGYRTAGQSVTLPLALSAAPYFVGVTTTGLSAFGAQGYPAVGSETTTLTILWTSVTSQASAARSAKWLVLGYKAV